jgi:hypothetical protein
MGDPMGDPTGPPGAALIAGLAAGLAAPVDKAAACPGPAMALVPSLMVGAPALADAASEPGSTKESPASCRAGLKSMVSRLPGPP